MKHTTALNHFAHHPRFWALPTWQQILPLLFACALILSLAGCTFNRLQGTADLRFVGRLALSQDADPNIPGSKADSWSAHFELAGAPQKGTLLLYTPVGTVVAQVSWEPGQAILETSDYTNTYRSLDELTLAHFQQTLPIAALFDWLQGQPTHQNITGWNVNLDRSSQGIISAERTDPAPRVRLRIAVDEFENRAQNNSVPSSI